MTKIGRLWSILTRISYILGGIAMILRGFFAGHTEFAPV